MILVFSTTSVTMSPFTPLPRSIESSQLVNRQPSPSTAALRIISRTFVTIALRSNKPSNSADTISVIISSRLSFAYALSGIALMAKLSEVMFATWCRTICLSIFIVGVGSPLLWTPSHCLPMKKFSLTLTVSASLILLLKSKPLLNCFQTLSFNRRSLRACHHLSPKPTSHRNS